MIQEIGLRPIWVGDLDVGPDPDETVALERRLHQRLSGDRQVRSIMPGAERQGALIQCFRSMQLHLSQPQFSELTEDCEANLAVLVEFLGWGSQ